MEKDSTSTLKDLERKVTDLARQKEAVRGYAFEHPEIVATQQAVIEEIEEEERQHWKRIQQELVRQVNPRP